MTVGITSSVGLLGIVLQKAEMWPSNTDATTVNKMFFIVGERQLFVKGDESQDCKAT